MSLPPILQTLRLPVIGAPLFIISNPDLVIAQCKAGIVGAFPALNARPQELLETWLKRIREELSAHDAAHPDRPAAPFAVNQIVHRSNDRLAHDLDLCVKYEVPIVITSLGAREDVNEAVHSYGGIVLHDIINNTFAHKAVDKGADGLIAVAAGAGGHAGTLSPIALLHEIREWWQGPLALSGAIGSGRAILAAQVLGADLAYMGSAFIATQEANAQADYKEMIVKSGASDIVYTNLFTGVPGNYLKHSISGAGLDPDNLPSSDASKMNFGTSREKPKAWRDIWGAGQSVTAVKAVVPAAERIAQLAREYDDALASIAALRRARTP
ncbi:MAG: NAD(P)H-dependent flavin oxidoreductase [Hyphomicrobiaceae bacterium]